MLDRFQGAGGLRPVPFAPYPLLPFFDERLYLYALLREDVRAGLPLETAAAQERFVAWWVLIGKDDMPDHALSTDAHACVTQAMAHPPGLPVPLTRVVLAPLHHMPHAREWLEPDGTVGLKYLAWFLLAAVPMFKLDRLLAPEALAWLASPADGTGTPGFTTLAALLLAMRPDLKARFDVSDPVAKTAYSAWLLNGGLAQLGLPFYQQSAPVGPYVSAKPGRLEPPTRTGGVNLIGYADAELGIGEDLRTTALALRTAGIPFSVFNVSADSRIRRSDGTVRDFISDSLPFDTSIFCLTGFECGRLLVEFGPRLFQGRRNIGYWPWELPRWPAELQLCYGLMTEVWASSRFARDCYAADGRASVHHMPLAVLDPAQGGTPVRRDRARFGLPADRFLFLYTFDVSSYLHRKHPLGAVEAFRRAFQPGDAGVGLVVKAMRGGEDKPEWQALMRHCAADSRIVVINEVLDRPDVLALFASCDSYVSLHRSEGFGRTIAEAMVLGLPTIATDWSGNTDFLTAETGFPVRATLTPVADGEYPFAEGNRWADPDLDHAAELMRAVRGGGPEVARRALAGQALIRTHHGAAAAGARYATRLANLWAVGSVEDRGP